MDDIPWLYVAMIFIAFVSWVSNQLKEVAAARRARAAERKAEEQSRHSTEPEWEQPTREFRRPEPPTVESTPPEPEPPQTFKDVFRELERQLNPQPEAKAPPPLPKSNAGDISEIEIVPDSLLENVTETEIAKTEVAGSEISGPALPNRSYHLPQRRGSGKSLLLGETLRDRDKLQTALILKEILDPPKALQRR